MNHFGYDTGDFIPCEISGERAVDIHHIQARGMGGSKKSDEIENLMALTRDLHTELGDKKQYIEGLKVIHEAFLQTRTPWLEYNDNLPWNLPPNN